MFDCVLPTRNARNGQIFTRNGIVNIRNAKWKHHHQPLDTNFPSDLCCKYNMSYIHHLFRANEILGLELASLHNLTFYMWLMQEIRTHIAADDYHIWYPEMVKRVQERL
jgi:queuine tRNA-ribosyltransferase